MSFLEQLKQDPNCLYIYCWGPYIYGLSKECDNYLVVVSDDWKNNNINDNTWDCYIFSKDGIGFVIYKIKEWFKRVMDGELDCWECACLSKKFVIKEHVKLTMTTNPISLRNHIDAIKYNSSEAIQQASIYSLWSVVKDCKFANQIIDNHKIINFHEANKDYVFFNGTSNPEDAYRKLFYIPYDRLKSKTDGLLLKNKIEKVLKQKKDE